MNRVEKEVQVDHLRSIFQGYDVVFVVHYQGLSVANMEQLRNDISSMDSGFKVVKNSLASLAADGVFDKDAIKQLFVGPVAILWGSDPVGLAKTLSSFVGENQVMQIIGGFYLNRMLSAKDVAMLASLPAMDEIRGKLVGMLVSVSTKIAMLSNASANKLAGVIGAYSRKE